MLSQLKQDQTGAMKQIFQRTNRYQSLRLLLPVFLGFVILTASTNLPDFDDAVSTFETADTNSSLMNKESIQTKSSETTPDFSSEKALGWGAKSDVLP